MDTGNTSAAEAPRMTKNQMPNTKEELARHLREVRCWKAGWSREARRMTNDKATNDKGMTNDKAVRVGDELLCGWGTNDREQVRFHVRGSVVSFWFSFSIWFSA